MSSLPSLALPMLANPVGSAVVYDLISVASSVVSSASSALPPVIIDLITPESSRPTTPRNDSIVRNLFPSPVVNDSTSIATGDVIMLTPSAYYFGPINNINVVSLDPIEEMSPLSTASSSASTTPLVDYEPRYFSLNEDYNILYPPPHDSELDVNLEDLMDVEDVI